MTTTKLRPRRIAAPASLTLERGADGRLRARVAGTTHMVTRIEVIDPNERRPIATTALDRQVISVLPERQVAILHRSEAGVPRVEILHVRLTGR